MAVVKVGIVGCGEIAQVSHISVLTFLSDKFKVVALCDASEESLKHCSSKFGVSKTYTDYPALVKDPEVELVMILAPDVFHADYAILASNHGKAVFMEKPMALTQSEADRIVEVQKQNRTLIFIGYMRRYAPAFLYAKEIVSKMQKITYVRVRTILGGNSQIVPQSGTYPKKFTDFPPGAGKEIGDRWAAVASEALEGINDVANLKTYQYLVSVSSHDFSAMREILGGIPKRALVSTRAPKGWFVSSLFEYENFHASYECGIDSTTKFDSTIEIFGDGKRVKVTYDSPYIKGLPVTATVMEADEEGRYTEQTFRPTYMDPFTEELNVVHRCVTEKLPTKTDPEDAALDLKMFDMFMRSLVN
ncbi:NAD(P)-binding protein [Meredithblackwellia eburnea MCA 4105]